MILVDSCYFVLIPYAVFWLLGTMAPDPFGGARHYSSLRRLCYQMRVQPMLAISVCCGDFRSLALVAWFHLAMSSTRTSFSSLTFVHSFYFWAIYRLVYIYVDIPVIFSWKCLSKGVKLFICDLLNVYFDPVYHHLISIDWLNVTLTIHGADLFYGNRLFLAFLCNGLRITWRWLERNLHL